MQLSVKSGTRKWGWTSRKYQDLCNNADMDFIPLHFLDQPIEVNFDIPPTLQKSPDMPPNGFSWEGKTYRVVEMLASWNDFKRRGRMAQNMQPAHAAVASTRGSLNVGRFYFRVRVALVSSSTADQSNSTTDQSNSTAGQSEQQIFDIYYDRAMKNVDERKGQWFVYREMRAA